MAITAPAIEAGAAIGALVLAVWGSVNHYVGKHFRDQRTYNRIEDAIFGYRNEPGILRRLGRLESAIWQDHQTRRHDDQ